jgi:hypothetical protein
MILVHARMSFTILFEVQVHDHVALNVNKIWSLNHKGQGLQRTLKDSSRPLFLLEACCFYEHQQITNLHSSNLKIKIGWCRKTRILLDYSCYDNYIVVDPALRVTIVDCLLLFMESSFLGSNFSSGLSTFHAVVSHFRFALLKF